MTDVFVMVDVYRDDFLLRRETIGGLPRAVEIGSDPRCRIWLDSARVEPVAAQLAIEEDGTTFLVGPNAPVGVGTAFRVGPFTLVLVKGGGDPTPEEPERMLESVRAGLQWPRLVAPDPGPAATSCPRCAAPLAESAMPGGAAYRSAPVTVLACDACRLLVVPQGILGDARALGESPAARRRKSTVGFCPTCRTNLQGLVLSWGDDWLSIELCDGCGAMVVDRSEVSTLLRIVAGVERSS